MRKSIHRISTGNTQSAGESSAGSGQPLSILESVFGETVALFHRLRVVAEQVHGQGEMSAGRRGILRNIDRLGPQTVPQMARDRPVSRQHIQTLVNELAKEGLVDFIDNPAHKRSSLVHLTRKGKVTLDAMNQREAKLLGALDTGIAEKDLRTAAAVLRRLRESFEDARWKRLLQDKRGNTA